MLYALITNIIFFQEKTKSKIDNSDNKSYLFKIPTFIAYLEILVFGVFAEDEAVDGGIALLDGICGVSSR